MNSTITTTGTWELDKPTDLRSLLVTFANHPIFSQPESFLNQSNPFQRPLRPQDITSVNLDRKSTERDITTKSSLLFHRMLNTIYETDLLFIPKEMDHVKHRAFEEFYADEFRVMGEQLRPHLERHLFGFLGDEVDVTGTWTMETFRFYTEATLSEVNSGTRMNWLQQSKTAGILARLRMSSSSNYRRTSSRKHPEWDGMCSGATVLLCPDYSLYSLMNMVQGW